MRIAILSDVHGNPIGLDAVLTDITRQGGVDALWVLGDLAALGYDPVGAMDRLAALPDACFVRGTRTGSRSPVCPRRSYGSAWRASPSAWASSSRRAPPTPGHVAR